MGKQMKTAGEIIFLNKRNIMAFAEERRIIDASRYCYAVQAGA